jgi:hypothetical protein
VFYHYANAVDQLKQAGTTELAVGDKLEGLGYDKDLDVVVTEKKERKDLFGTATEYTFATTGKFKDRHWLGFQLDHTTDGWEKTLSFADKLNKLRCWPEVSGGKVVCLVRDDGDERELLDEEYEYLGLAPDEDDYGCVDAHPEGSDRGGYVPTLRGGSYYYEPAGEWN